MGFVFFFEYLDNRIKTPEEIKAYLGLAMLGMVPAVPPQLAGTTSLLLTNGVPANFEEAFNELRTSVLFSSTGDHTRSFTVTSTGPGEGKTLVASNLAVALAQTGQRVLVIDADMRRPRIHDVFGQSQEPGLSNLLVGSAKAGQVIRKTSVEGLWGLTAGKEPPNPAVLLGSARFKDLVVSLGEHFDWVVIDSPPVMAVTDASVVAHVVLGVVFVVGAEMTSRQAASNALELLEHAGARFVGAVLNRVDLDRNAYYYSHYYRREYSEYYTRKQA